MFHPGRRSLAAAALLALTSAGCILPTWRPALRGVLIDEDTEQPQPGITVTVWYEARGLGPPPPKSARRVDERTVTTNANGEFFVPGHFEFAFAAPLRGSRFAPSFAVRSIAYDDPLWFYECEPLPRGLRSVVLQVRRSWRAERSSRPPVLPGCTVQR